MTAIPLVAILAGAVVGLLTSSDSLLRSWPLVRIQLAAPAQPLVVSARLAAVEVGPELADPSAPAAQDMADAPGQPEAAERSLGPDLAHRQHVVAAPFQRAHTHLEVPRRLDELAHPPRNRLDPAVDAGVGHLRGLVEDHVGWPDVLHQGLRAADVPELVGAPYEGEVRVYGMGQPWVYA
jgi:hypothetical protein